MCTKVSWNANRERYASHYALSQFRFSIQNQTGPFQHHNRNVEDGVLAGIGHQRSNVSRGFLFRSIELTRCRKEIEGKDTQDLKKCEKIAFGPSKLLVESGDICKRLEVPSYAKIYLGMLTPRNLCEEAAPTSYKESNF